MLKSLGIGCLGVLAGIVVLIVAVVSMGHSHGARFGPSCIAYQAMAGNPSPLSLVWTSGFSDHKIKLT